MYESTRNIFCCYFYHVRKMYLLLWAIYSGKLNKVKTMSLQMSSLGFKTSVFKSYVLTNTGNNFYSFCHLPSSQIFMEEWFTLFQGEQVSYPGPPECLSMAVKPLEPYSLTCLCCGCQFLISSASPMLWPILVCFTSCSQDG